MVRPMAPQAATISFRLGGRDGVSVEARKWDSALHELGFETRRIAGEIEDGGRPDDVTLPGLAITASHAPAAGDIDFDALRAAVADSELLVVDNICSLPLNIDASRVVARIAAEHPGCVVFRHHDLPWQRRNLLHLETEFPPREPDDALHITVNLRSRRELEARGYRNAVTVHNYFDFDAPPGERAATRRAFGFTDDELVVFQPARAIERKNVPGGLRFTTRLSALGLDLAPHYWLSGPAEDRYDQTLERIVERATIPFTVGRAESAADGYAASDVIVFPSTWEGFGNPTIESIIARRPCAVFPYPVLAEILAAGVRLFTTERPEAVAKFLREPESARAQTFDVNLRRARLSFDIAELPGAIEAAFRAHGWTSW
jgi:glycosyltransferase involved in cell wall biosynthesis